MLLKTPFWWENAHPIAYALLPFSRFYSLMAAWREKWCTPAMLPVPVICIGNAVAGGAGKTPVALAVGEWLQARGKKVAFVTRGYGGRLTGPLQVDTAAHTADEVGDEALLLARLAPTFMGKNRVQAAQAAVKAGAQIIVLDDGLQNPSIAKTLSVLVVDGTYGFGNGYVLPAGPLREKAQHALARVQAVVVIGGAFVPDTYLPVLRAELAAVQETLRGKRVLGFAGIGRPEKFRATLEKLGCEIAGFQAFADHHPYREHELHALAAQAEAAGAPLVTTEKDAVRLPPAWRERVGVVSVRLEWAQPDKLAALLEPLCA